MTPPGLHEVPWGETRPMHMGDGEILRKLLLASEILNALVRPCLAVIFGGAIVWMAIIGTISSGEFLGIAAVVVGFFFQARQAEKAEEQLRTQTQQMVALAKEV